MNNLLRSDDILWAGDITGTAQRITLSHIWARKLISSEAFARIFKPGHTYTLSYSGKVIEPAPDTGYREDRRPPGTPSTRAEPSRPPIRIRET